MGLDLFGESPKEFLVLGISEKCFKDISILEVGTIHIKHRTFDKHKMKGFLV